jgi:adenine phosphoribosyltransferase
MHKGIVMPQSRVLVIDDVLATGGTAEACVKLLESAQAVVVGCSFLVELKDLGGRERLGDHRIETVLTY